MKKILASLLLFSGFANAQINIPDPVLKAYLLSADTTNDIAFDISNHPIRIDTNNNNEIELAEAALIPGLYINATGISDLTGIKEFANLKNISIFHGTLTSLDFSGMPQLNSIDVSDLPVANFNFSGASNVQTFRFTSCPSLVALDLRDLTGLVTVLTDPNNTTLMSINAAGLQNLTSIQAFENHVTDVDLSGTGQFQLNDVGIFNYLQHCNVSNSGVINLVANSTNLTTVNASNCLALKTADILSNVGVGISSLNLTNCPALENLTVTNSTFNTLDLTGTNGIKVINITAGSNMTSFDVSRQYRLEALYLDGPFEYVNLKNGHDEVFGEFNSAPETLKYICADESDMAYLATTISENVIIHSYCSFVPGGNYNTISGNVRFDSNNNGCDNSDAPIRYLKIKADAGSDHNATITDTAGNYAIYTLAGNFLVGPVLERFDIFNVNPPTANANFADNNNNAFLQDFCISSIGIHPDLEIVIAPFTTIRPGFDAVYKIVYKNKGNQVLSGNITFGFENQLSDFISAVPTPENQSNGSLVFNYSNLAPFESREILVTLNINSPVETPPVNLNDVLHFSAHINPVVNDDMPFDNSFQFNQTVINSFDPNNKTCLEGETLDTSHIGRYVHYNINFENTGTADATNIVLKDIIDTTKFNIDSLQVLNSSHPVNVKIKGNVVEFIFEGINLPPSIRNPIGGHGNVLFKIKTNPNLSVDDVLKNTANIYFDYNAPILTNEAQTTFRLLSSQEFEHDSSIKTGPNPVKDFIKIQSKNTIRSIQLFDVQGRILQTSIESKKETVIDLAKHSKGIYFLKITTEKGSKIEKILKE